MAESNSPCWKWQTFQTCILPPTSETTINFNETIRRSIPEDNYTTQHPRRQSSSHPPPMPQEPEMPLRKDPFGKSVYSDWGTHFPSLFTLAHCSKMAATIWRSVARPRNTTTPEEREALTYLDRAIEEAIVLSWTVQKSLGAGEGDRLPGGRHVHQKVVLCCLLLRRQAHQITAAVVLEECSMMLFQCRSHSGAT
jgi:hypothetical protein